MAVNSDNLKRLEFSRKTVHKYYSFTDPNNLGSARTDIAFEKPAVSDLFLADRLVYTSAQIACEKTGLLCPLAYSYYTKTIYHGSNSLNPIHPNHCPLIEPAFQGGMALDVCAWVAWFSCVVAVFVLIVRIICKEANRYFAENNFVVPEDVKKTKLKRLDEVYENTPINDDYKRPGINTEFERITCFNWKNVMAEFAEEALSSASTSSSCEAYACRSVHGTSSEPSTPEVGSCEYLFRKKGKKEKKGDIGLGIALNGQPFSREVYTSTFPTKSTLKSNANSI